MKKSTFFFLVLMMLTFALKAQDVFLWNFNTIDKSNLIFEEKDSIYDFAQKQWLDNNYFNYHTYSSIGLKSPVGHFYEMSCFLTAKKQKSTLQFFHQPLDSLGRLQGQFYYVTKDSFIIVSGYFKNDTLEGFYMENKIDFVEEKLYKEFDSCSLADFYNFGDSMFLRNTYVTKVSSFKVKEVWFILFSKGYRQVSFSQSLDDKQPLSTYMVLNGSKNNFMKKQDFEYRFNAYTKDIYHDEETGRRFKELKRIQQGDRNSKYMRQMRKKIRKEGIK